MLEQNSRQAFQSGHRPAPATPPQSGIWQRFTVRVRSWFEIPYGYEDEYGFHYGHEPVPAPVAARLAKARRVFTDRACDAMLSPSPVPPSPAEAPVEERHQTA